MNDFFLNYFPSSTLHSLFIASMAILETYMLNGLLSGYSYLFITIKF